MTKEAIATIISAARTKAELVENSLPKFLVLSVLAGIYVGFGVMLVFSIGAPLHAAGSPAVKALMGASFAVALSLVIFAGSELFTGNHMFMTIASLAKQVTWKDTWKVLGISFIGNLAGSLLLALLLVQSGLLAKGPIKNFVLEAVAGKMQAPFMELFFRGILCNILVCLAIWMAAKTKEDIAKLVLIFWCLFAFVGAGFEHSVANMTLMGLGLFIPHDPEQISWIGYVKNLIPVSLGNWVGGACLVGASYWYVGSDRPSRKTKKAKKLESVPSFETWETEPREKTTY
ncbi:MULTISPECIES: formate/nitrite transporter family protein [Trichocoleus]|uniref:Formate/nitrite transporter family protein n=1 Tax=Trichocoleus desertorum GB2-A4 TaxID=2933944 RepID=A0ABV0J5P8_9CYAN|nr:formate/nitrite transporter family protein [Trichocoleus sp. FACHB-46]MBD1863949.1 formate/nitrite transporter family protein [Trichocoleus sp. FACHB-46]